MSDKTAVQELAELFNKHLTEPIKEKLKTTIAAFKAESKDENDKLFAEVKLKAESFIKENKDTVKVEAVKVALSVAEKDATKIDALKVLLEEAPPTESYNEAPLADGTILKYTGEGPPAVGAKCLLVTPEGEVPAPEGEHKLADGSTIVIAKEGEDSVISEVKPAEKMKDQAILAMIQKAVENAVKEKFTSIEKENKALKAELEATKLKLSKKSSQLSDLGIVVEAMASIGTGEPINKPNTNKPNERMTPLVKPRF